MRKTMFLLGYGLVGLASWGIYTSAIVPDAKGLTALDKVIAENAEPARTMLEKVYRWQDQQGNWQFSDQPPADKNIDAQIVAYQQELHTLQQARQSIQADLPATQQDTLKKVVAEAHNSDTLSPVFSALTQAEKIYQLAHDATDVQKKLDDRKAELDQLLQEAGK